MDSRTLALRLIIIFFFFAITIFCALDSDKARYAEMDCQRRLLNAVGQKKVVDFAFLGSSRSRESINTGLMTSALNRKLESPDLVVLDLSRSGRASGMTYVMARDLLNNVKVKNLIIEFNATSKMYHRQWSSIATYNDLFEDLKSRKSLGLVKRIDLFLKHSAEKVSKKFVRLIKLDHKQDKKVNERVSKLDCSKTYYSEQEGLREAARLENLSWENNFSDWSLNSTFESRNDFYIKKLSSLAKSKNVNLIFTHYYSTYSPPLSREFSLNFQSKYGHQLINISSINLLRQLYSRGYRDVTHLKLSGQKVYTNWFVDNALRYKSL